MPKTRSYWLLIIGLLLGLGTAIGLKLYINHSQTGLSLYRLKPETALAAGERIQENMLDAIQVPTRFGALTSLAVEANDINRRWIVGRRVNEDIAKGDFLFYRQLIDAPEKRLAEQVTPGRRGLAIQVNATSAVSHFIQPGSLVDILGTLNQPARPVMPPAAAGNAVGAVLSPEIQRNLPPEAQRALQAAMAPQPAAVANERVIVTKTLLQGVRVLAVGKATTRDAYLKAVEGQGYSTVTVEVTPLEAERLIFAMQQALGGLTLVLRNPADDAQVALPSMRWDGFERP